MRRILVTGAAGFIGYHLTKRLLKNGDYVFGIDNMNDYYDVRLKEDRLKDLFLLPQAVNFHFEKIDIAEAKEVRGLLQQGFDIVIHLAAQAGVRYSLESPESYTTANIVGFSNMLEAIRKYPVDHFIFASSSSVYGMNQYQPFSTDDRTDFPVSYYAATKKANEVMAFSYSHLFNIPTTGLRFFTVYGPFGRPDMAYFKFLKSIIAGNPIDLYNAENMYRDFTYIDDIVEGIFRVLPKAPATNTFEHTHSNAPYRLLNIGNSSPVLLGDFISVLEKSCGKKAVINHLPMQPGDVLKTFADTNDFFQLTGFRPTTSIEDGIRKFAQWYLNYYSVEL